jgi:RNA recognition motif-containing protein
MSEKEEREGVGREDVDNDWKLVEGKKPQRRKGFVHRLEQNITSFFFTNFPEDATVNDLWFEFWRFGCVGEVYLPKKLDKQGRRFGFVKYREVRDVRELQSCLEEIWLGSFKLRVNISRFGKGEPRKVEERVIPEMRKAGETIVPIGRSFKEALAKPQSETTLGQGLVQGVREVAWEVEVEMEVMSKLQGAFVGFLEESRDCQDIQNSFLMEGYSNLKVMALFLKLPKF